MSVKECGHHEEESRKLVRLIMFGVGGFLFVLLLTIFIIWAVLRPTKPKFIIQDATLYAFNLSSAAPNTITITMQVTLSSHNPNSRIGIYYSNLHAHASYHNQQVTLATELPPTYQGHKDFTVWSPFLFGTAAPVSPFTLSSLQQDRATGAVVVNVKVYGRVKWKVGTWVSGRYHLFVNCPAYIRFSGSGDRSGSGIQVVSPVKFQLLQGCSVDV
ncbi:hypothetical protein PIB30_018570 [Stylosanthes scabra]|uniref:Late embryogenesis abundant protein LEA-2 subgroup domain-containing protein n=1 Tax=Stylosanthes scabra TaxID=79078 RepID=A0ABU6R871_9FABA|nr:hypothetical protein [Stylosanthes scabra]